jgi:hypothetical protein
MYLSRISVLMNIFLLFLVLFYNSEDEDDDNDNEDDEAELQAELERIREERALAAARKEQEEKQFEEKYAQEQALRSNPLLNLEKGSAQVHHLFVSVVPSSSFVCSCCLLFR